MWIATITNKSIKWGDEDDANDDSGDQEDVGNYNGDEDDSDGFVVVCLLKYLVGQRHRKPGRELEGFWQTAVEPSWGKNRYHCIHIHAIIDSHHHGSHVIIMITITTTIIVQVFLFLTLPFHRLRISPLSAGKTLWEPKGKKVPRWPASSTEQALYFLVLRVKTVHLQRVQYDPVKYYFCLRRVGPVKRNANVSSSTFTVTPSIAPPSPPLHLGRGEGAIKGKIRIL